MNLSNVELAKIVTVSLQFQGFDANYDNILNEIDISRSPQDEAKDIETNMIADVVNHFVEEAEENAVKLNDVKVFRQDNELTRFDLSM